MAQAPCCPRDPRPEPRPTARTPRLPPCSPPPSADWRALLQAAPGSEGAAPPAALVAVPLQASAAQYCLGAASFALESEPSPAGNTMKP